MKRLNFMMAFAIAATLVACKKHECPTASNPEAAFHSELQGTYEQVGFKNDLFNEWSYTSSGPVFAISATSISDPFNTDYQIVDPGLIYLEQQHETARITFGDTVIVGFQDGDSLKLIKQ